MEKLLTETENKLYRLIDYKCNKWGDKDRARLIRERLAKELKSSGLANYDQLLIKLEKADADAKAAAGIKEAEAKALADAKEKVTAIVYKNFCKPNNVCSWPTKTEAERLIQFPEFGKLTAFARGYYILTKLSKAFNHAFYFRLGAHDNTFSVLLSEKHYFVETEQSNNWGVYSKKTKYPAHDYYFRLFLPKNYSFARVGGLLTIFKGKKIIRDGMPVTWCEQGQGMNLNEIQGYLVRGFHVKKTKSIDTLEKAIAKIRKQRSSTARDIREKRFWKRLTKEQITDKLQQIWITEADSIAAGNCPAGTQNFKSRYQSKNGFGEVGAVRGDELIAQANGEMYFIRKIFAHKFGISV